MSENESREIFSAVRYKSLNYVFETATSLKVMMNLLALPTPYLTETSDLYPHSGHLPEGTYRTPWIRGIQVKYRNVISTCKLFLNGSVLDELRKNNQATYESESYNDSLTYLQEDVEVIPSSNPDSLNELDLNEVGKILIESSDPCQETFSMMPTNQINPENERKDLYLPEDLMEVDYLKQFKSHLPSLKTKLSRLRMLPVADPLLSLKHDSVSEDTFLRRCEPYEMPPQLRTSDNGPSTISLEDFSKELLINEEHLVLPNVLETFSLIQGDCSALSNTCDLLTLTPEEINEQLSVLEIMKKTTKDIFQVEMYEEHTKESSLEGFTDAEFAGQMKTPVDMELDLTLSPVPKACHTSVCPSTSGLNWEQLSPLKQISLGSLRAHRELEMALWTAEKHPMFVLGFMLTEPQTCDPTVDFHPLLEALRFLKAEKQCFVSGEIESMFGTGVQQIRLCNSTDFTESISSDFSSSKINVEEFRKIIPEQDFPIKCFPNMSTPRSQLSILKRPEEPALITLAENKQRENETVPRPQTVNIVEAKTSSLSCPETLLNNTKKVQDHVFITNLVDEPNNADHTAKEKSQSQPSALKQTLPLRKDNPKCLLESKCPPHKDLDPLSTFIMLRSQQNPAVTATPPPSSPVSPDVVKQRPHCELQTTNQRMYVNATVSGNASREQNRVVSQPVCPLTSHLNEQHIPVDRQNSRVIHIPATESQYHAYYEVLSLAQPHLSFAQQLGLDMKVWGDFRYLTLDQTHFLIKQQEKARCRTNSHNVDLVRDQERLFNQVTLIHVLVTFKELLLKCGLSTGVEYLKKTRNTCAEKGMNQLLKRLQIILYLSHKKQETNPKLLELQRLLTMWLHNRNENNVTDKILVLITNDSDNTRSSILSCLHQVMGTAVTDLHLDKNKIKLNGAIVVSRMCNNVCALVCEQHIGPDFPWQCFSLVVEYDHPGQSPWAAVCRERGSIHVTFNTILPNNDKEESSWCLEDSVPYVLFVTEGLLNCPMLLQTLESKFTITVLERNHCMTLQMLGGTHQYAVITVDESTAIVIQKQEELCQESASEGLVMRLAALSLQYSCCWLILHCPDSQGGGLSSEAFNNLILVYSSLVLFSMKSEDLDVKVLIVSDVMEIARWISHISFYSLMSSDRDLVSYLDREWLTVIQSNEEKCLLHFPCISPLVSQLMLRRAPNIQWLLRATLPQLTEMFPDLPHKVLKLFNDTTSLYTETTDSNQFENQTVTRESDQQTGLNNSTWINSGDAQHLGLIPEQFLFGATNVQDSICNTASTEEAEPNLRFKMSPSFINPDVYMQKSWTISDLWKNDRDEVKPSDWGSRAGVVGKTVGRADFLRPLTHINTSMKFSHSYDDSLVKAESTFSYNRVNTNCDLQQSYGLSSPTEVMKWGQILSPNETFPSSGGMTSASYGSKSFVGQERKRSAGSETLLGTVLTPLKRNRLSYERVPGRSDGQTRLKLF